MAVPVIPPLQGKFVFAILISFLFAAWRDYPQPPLNLSDESSFPWAMARAKFAGTGDDDRHRSGCPLAGVRVVVTGATAGIGRSLALVLLDMGGTVYAVGRSPSKLDALAADAEGRGRGCDLNGAAVSKLLPIKMDLNDLRSVSDGADEIVRLASSAGDDNGREGGIDILVNNGGMYQKNNSTQVTAQGYDQTFGVNYLSHFLLTEKLLLLLRRRRGTIVQVSSSFHWAVDGGSLRTDPSKSESSPPLASVQGGGTSFVFRNQRSYANSKLAQILHARASARREKDVVRIASACPAWVGTEIGGEKGSSVHSLLSSIAFPVDGWGLASILTAMFDNDKGDGDYYGNTRAMDIFLVPHAVVGSPLFFVSRMRDLFGYLLAYTCLLPLQKFFAAARVAKSSSESYDLELQESLYEWSKSAISEWL